MKQRNIDRIQWEINWNNKEGVHTFSMCKCGRLGHRGKTRACSLCLEEELQKLL